VALKQGTGAGAGEPPNAVAPSEGAGAPPNALASLGANAGAVAPPPLLPKAGAALNDDAPKYIEAGGDAPPTEIK
jgi:hypothetical protein